MDTQHPPVREQRSHLQINILIFGVIFGVIAVGIPFIIAKLLPPPWVPLSVIVVVGAVARTRATGRRMDQLLHRASRFVSLHRGLTTFTIWLLASAYFCFTAFYQHRDLFPRIHDEHCYLIQARMLASGQLWAPQHPVADFFDNFYMLARPVYAPIYFPGTALADAPFVRLGAPYWLMPVLAAGLVVALVFSVVTTLIDELAGLVAVFCAITNWGLREFSTIVMAQVPLTLLVLLAFWSWLRWRNTSQLRWMGAAGAFLGWAAIPRPVDALAFALPIGVATLWTCRPRSVKHVATIALVVCLAAVPFLLLQLILNRGTTGSVFKSPYSVYLETDAPGSGYGFGGSAVIRQPQSALAQKRDYLDRFRSDEIRQHTIPHIPQELIRRVFWTGVCTLPAGILALLLPASVLGFQRPDRLALLAVAPVFLLLYLPNPFFLVHYTIPLVPVTAFLLALAIHELARGDTRIRALFSIIVIAVCLSVTPEFRPDVRDGVVPPMPLTAMLHHQLADAVSQAGAVVLFRYQAGDNPVEDPVYNDDVLWPDDARVIRAHDLGTRNIEIAHYFASTQPWRRFYLLSRQENVGRATLLLHPVGTAAEYERALNAQHVGTQ